MTHPPLAGGVDGPAVLVPLVAAVLEQLAVGASARGGPLPRGGPAAFPASLPDDGVGELAALSELTGALTRGAADPADPHCAGHLHCPPLAVAVAAELAVAVLNQSLDSWDQAPAASALETSVIRALAGLAGYDAQRAGGAMTSGGTESNLMGVLLARDAAARDGLGRLRVLCSAAAHFSVQRNAGILGLGEAAVVAVATDAAHRMRPEALEAQLIAARGTVPVAIVATAGTTDLGAIDPLPEIAALAREHAAWLHVDAAYGGGALFSDRLAPLLTGLADADSISLDLHKLGWLPVPAGVFLTRDADSFGPLTRRVAYLNPADDEEQGYDSLLGRSLRTTRRADAVKAAVVFQAIGRRGLGAMVDTCHNLARHAAGVIAARPELELTAQPVLTTVVFRHRGGDAVNAELRRRLLTDGAAVVGRTEIGGRVHLKLTLLNPHARTSDVDTLVELIVAAGKAVA